MNKKLTSSTYIPQYFPRWSTVIFFLFLIGCSLAYNYHEILFFKPQSTHQYRQSDCLSITKNYYHEGMKFFEPSIHNLISDGGKSGKTIGEFPGLYYTVAMVWQVFQPHEFYYRALMVIIAFLGLLALFKTYEHIFRDSVWAMILGLLMFTFPIFAFYTNNFLTNVPGLSFAFLGLYWFYFYYDKRKEKYLWLSAFFFLIGGLLKITALISFLALFGIFLLEWIVLIKPERFKIFFNPGKAIIPFLVVFLTILGWYGYAEYYNSIHGGKYTFNSIWPIWSMKSERIQATLNQVNEIWLGEYFSPLLGLLLFLSLLVALIKFKKLPGILSWLITISLFGGMLYLILWFNALHDHDYYVINLLIIPALTFGGLGVFLKQKHPGIFDNLFIKVALLVFLGYNVAYCAEKMENRYWGGWNNCWGKCDFFNNDEYAEINPKLRKLGITRTDTVISIPDVSFNISLYLMDVKGYTNMGQDNTDSAEIAANIKNGADYLVIGDTSYHQKAYLNSYLEKKVLSHDNLTVYDLNPIKEKLKDN